MVGCSYPQNLRAGVGQISSKPSLFFAALKPGNFRSGQAVPFEGVAINADH
jgi:hypothetical protein